MITLIYKTNVWVKFFFSNVELETDSHTLVRKPHAVPCP